MDFGRGLEIFAKNLLPIDPCFGVQIDPIATALRFIFWVRYSRADGGYDDLKQPISGVSVVSETLKMTIFGTIWRTLIG